MSQFEMVNRFGISPAAIGDTAIRFADWERMSLAVRHDDRLRMVLALPAASPHARSMRWRQLVELLAAGNWGDPSMFERAMQIVRIDSATIDEDSRMAAARAIASPAVPAELVAVFAGDRLDVAGPLLAAARLTACEWAEVAAAASIECRQFIAALSEQAATAGGSAIPLISEADGPVMPLAEQGGSAAPSAASEQPRLFHWECGESGEIDWVEGIPRGAAIGRSICQPTPSGPPDPRAARAFALRLPLRNAALELSGGAAGRWLISGKPAFDPSSGRFCGYRGVGERARLAAASPMLALRDPDSLRELAHEIRTPLNAIIGFAEIISGQYLGPAGRPYRERAEGIVAQAQLLLTAIDDLDFAARLHSQPGRDPTGLAGAIGRVAGEFARAGASFDISAEPVTSLGAALSERLMSRFFKTVIDLSDEPPTFALEEDESHCIVSVTSPSGEPDLGLQLVHGLARIAGGNLRTGSGRLELLLPKD